ncbi:hypothetical protein [Corynebacterium auriscanis]|uniref:Uncharacterized protein n=1 Tax=Corynebacterium auriscanis TaxID=99807 RepID=A0A0A2DK60_9CORY|nr:hypothetical protein [Corynebacterium auriscanis]KGM18162.1 hypothetical protein MA47_09790 [Corynebacterium auriscanis]WJY73247.1 hypothetical protein CAURIC_08170 [Corynebacterium auriscanis]
MEPIQRQLKRWGTARLCEEAARLIRDKGDGSVWEPFMQELIVRALGKPATVKRPASVHGGNLAELENKIVIQQLQLKGAVQLNEYLLTQVRAAKGVK